MTKNCKTNKENFDSKTILASSKAPKGKKSVIPIPEKGDIVYSKPGISKHIARDPFIVLESDKQGKSLIRKALHHSPHAKMALNFSPQTKLVDN